MGEMNYSSSVVKQAKALHCVPIITSNSIFGYAIQYPIDVHYKQLKNILYAKIIRGNSGNDYVGKMEFGEQETKHHGVLFVEISKIFRLRTMFGRGTSCHN